MWIDVISAVVLMLALASTFTFIVRLGKFTAEIHRGSASTFNLIQNWWMGWFWATFWLLRTTAW